MANVIEAKAELSVGRACAFGGIAIGTFMIGSITEPADAMRTGGVMTLLTCFILLLKANLALAKPYKRTELWLLLLPAERPLPEVAQVVIGRTLRTVFLRFALYAAALSLGLLCASLLFRWLPRPM
jgi:hypothetical protein